MPSDDILDLLGRYATGSLTEKERQRLFDAALDDQDLFEELAGEQELRALLEQPGARPRMIRALQPPRRKSVWIFGIAATGALSVALVVFLLRPEPKPPEVAVAKIPPPAAAAQTASAPAPSSTTVAPSPRKAKAATGTPEPPADRRGADALKTETDEARAVSAAPVAPQAAESFRARTQAQNSPGPKQIPVQSRAAATATLAEQKTSAFGFHYSLETKGHLIVVPGADGYLFVTASDGAILFSRKPIAAGIKTDIPIPDTADSITITFSSSDSPVPAAPVARSEAEGSVEGSTNLAIRLKINP